MKVKDWFYNKALQYSINGSHIKIYGTNQFLDLFITLDWLPIKGMHGGCYKAARWICENEKNFMSKGYIEIDGHSMGGSIGLCLGEISGPAYANVNGAYPVFFFKIRRPCCCWIYGNDPVPALFKPLYRFPKNTKVFIPHGKQGRKWYKILMPWNWGDHVKY